MPRTTSITEKMLQAGVNELNSFAKLDIIPKHVQYAIVINIFRAMLNSKRVNNLTSERRREIGRQGAKARWGNRAEKS